MKYFVSMSTLVTCECKYLSNTAMIFRMLSAKISTDRQFGGLLIS